MDETPLPTKLLIDGIDRLGKSSLVNMIQDELGYHLVIHYDKPKVLQSCFSDAEIIKAAPTGETDFESVRHLSTENLARYLYQYQTNEHMFDLMKTDIPIIFDRTHLGEMVYAPMYRKYSGEYVYDLELDLIKRKPFTYDEDIRLILLTSSNTEMLKDDGLSFDPTKKNEEQDRFIEAFHQSKLPNKVIVDVHDGNGGYRPHVDIFMEALHKLPNNSSL